MIHFFTPESQSLFAFSPSRADKKNDFFPLFQAIFLRYKNYSKDQIQNGPFSLAQDYDSICETY